MTTQTTNPKPEGGKMLPCPLCGGVALEIISDKEWNEYARGGAVMDVWHRIECDGCGLTLQEWASDHCGHGSEWDSSVAHAALLKKWNTRQTPPAAGGMELVETAHLETLRRALDEHEADRARLTEELEGVRKERDSLRGEVDAAKASDAANMQIAEDRWWLVLEARAEVERLSEILFASRSRADRFAEALRQCAKHVGAAVGPECSDDFHCMVAEEVRLVMEKRARTVVGGVGLSADDQSFLTSMRKYSGDDRCVAFASEIARMIGIIDRLSPPHRPEGGGM